MPIILLILVLLVVGFLMLRGAKAIDRRWRKRSDEIVTRFKPNVLFCREQFIGFRFDDRKVLVGDMATAYEYDFAQLTKCEITRDEIAVVSTNRGSQVAGALVGGALLGLPGLLIGSLTSSTTSTSNVKNVSLKVYVDDNVMPVHTVCFFAALGNGQKTNALNRKDLELAEMFYGHCLNAMKSDAA